MAYDVWEGEGLYDVFLLSYPISISMPQIF